MNGLRINILCVGKLKEKHFSEAASEYVKRLSRYSRLEIIEVADEPAPANYKEAQIKQVLEREGERMLLKLEHSDFVVPLCIDGRKYSSDAFARALSEWSEYKRVVFIIGGSHGLCDRVVARGDERMSLSDMTLPHQLARVVLLEQIYRAFKINCGETYHK